MAAQDLPFFTLGTILLVCTVERKDDVAELASNRFCSTEYDTGSYVVIVLNTMKTAGMLATKLVKLRTLPDLWEKRRTLQVEADELDQRLAQLESLETAAADGTESADDDQPEDNDPRFAFHGDAPPGPAQPEASYTVFLSLRRTERAFEWATCVGWLLGSHELPTNRANAG